MICILCALKTEAKPFLNALSGLVIKKLGNTKISEGSIGSVPVAVLICGAGKANAGLGAYKLIENYKPSCIIMSGTAGGIDNRIKIGDTVVGTEFAFHDVADDELLRANPFLDEPFIRSDEKLLDAIQQAIANKPPVQSVYYGRIATGNVFVNRKNRTNIIKRVNPLCVDMETAQAALICKKNKIPFIALRSITDTEEKSGLLTFFRYAKFASERSFAIVKTLLEQSPLFTASES